MKSLANRPPGARCRRAAPILALACAGTALAEEPVLGREDLRFSLDATLRYDAASSFDLPAQVVAPGTTGRQGLTRIRPTLSWDAGGGVGVIAQGQVYGSSETASSRSADLYQAYAAITRERFELRLGRQEVVLGSGFLLGADAFFDGAAYDAVHAVVRPRPGMTVSAFGGRCVASLSGGLGGSVAGVVVSAGRPGTGIEAYVVDDSAFATSVGARAVLERGRFLVEVEPVFQSGGAWGGHVEVAATLPLGGFRPRLIAGHAQASPGFTHARHDTSQVGDIGVIGDLGAFAAGDALAEGLRATSVGAEVPLGTRAALALAFRRFGAAEVTGASSHEIGREIDAVLTVGLSERIALALSVDQFEGGAFWREATGEGLRVRYGHAALGLRF